MTYYQPEPAYTHGSQPKVGILLANLGTPEAPTAKALRPYLQQFLMDRRVVEIPRLIWWCILHGIILIVRPKKSAEKYASIWRKDGSPLMVYAVQQKKTAARIPVTKNQLAICRRIRHDLRQSQHAKRD